MSIRLLLLTCVVLSPVSSFALDRPAIQARAEQIRKLSPIERDRLNRNIEAFQKLSETEKEHYRQIHRELKQDAASGGGLNSLLQTYAVWVQTLTPTQRDELQKEVQSSHRLALVRRFKEEQEEPSESLEALAGLLAVVPHDELATQVGPNFTKREAFWQKDLKGVMKVIASSIDADRMQPEFVDPRIADYLPLIHASVQSSGGNYHDWPEQKLLQEMIASLGKEQSQLLIKLNPKTKREALIRMLLLGVMKQARDIVKYPNEEEKLQILKELKPTDRELIMNQPVDRMNLFLIRKSMEMRGGDTLNDFRKIPEYHRQVEDLFQRFEVAPPPRFSGRVKKANERTKKKTPQAQVE